MLRLFMGVFFSREGHIRDNQNKISMCKCKWYLIVITSEKLCCWIELTLRFSNEQYLHVYRIQ